MFKEVRPKEAIHHCRFLVEAPVQNPLLALLENALGSSYFGPLSPEDHSLISDQKPLYGIILMIFLNIAATSHLQPLYNRIHATLPSARAGSGSGPYCGILLRTLKTIRMEWKISEEHTSTIPGRVQLVQETEAGWKPMSRKEFASLP